MKKAILILSVLMLFALTGCKKEIETAKSEAPKANSTIERMFAIETVSAQNNHAVFMLTNATDQKMTYGPQFTLDIYKDGQWEPIETDEPLSWAAVLYSLQPSCSELFNVDFEMTYGILKQGIYQLHLTICIDDGSPIDATHEFEIQ